MEYAGKEDSGGGHDLYSGRVFSAHFRPVSSWECMVINIDRCLFCGNWQDSGAASAFLCVSSSGGPEKEFRKSYSGTGNLVERFDPESA